MNPLRGSPVCCRATDSRKYSFLDLAPTLCDNVGMATTEHTINDALADLLRGTRRAWASRMVIRSENTRGLRGEEGRPDILIVEPGTPPIVVETEVFPAITVEPEARGRLGASLRDTGQPIYTAIAVRLPRHLRKLEGGALRKGLLVADDFEFAVLSGENETNVERWPSDGWLKGGVRALSTVIQLAAVPAKVIEQAANDLVEGISAAAGLFERVVAPHGGSRKSISEILHQQESSQTWRMAMTIVANAFIFQDCLAGGEGKLADVRSIEVLRGGADLNKTAVLREWRKILAINFWPIFDVARRIVEVLPTSGSSEVLGRLADTASTLLGNRLTRSHDITGAVFQKLIADRKFLAAYYTRPASATLLAGLAIKSTRTMRDGSWDAPADIESLRVADFSCGTGTLLSAAYHSIARLHELHGGDSASLHEAMMSSVLVGCDVMPAAAHLTASMLSGLYPSVSYSKSRITAVPYGRQEKGGMALGSLDLINTQGAFSILSHGASVVGGTEEQVANTWAELPDKSFDLVIMNPPYARATGHEGEKEGVPVPMFAAFGNDEEEQRKMSKGLSKLAKGTSAHGNAGEASYFFVLGDQKVRPGGTLALVMPLSLLAGEAWEKTRAVLRTKYSDMVVVSIAGGAESEQAFSADTGMAECLVVAKKGNGASRATFAVLERRPAHQLEATEIARLVRHAAGKCRRLEDGPVGGTTLLIGDTPLGSVIDAPLPADGPWPVARIADFSVAQTAHELAHSGRLWMPGLVKAKAVQVPIVRLDAFAKMGPYHMDINAKGTGGSIRGPFELTPVTKAPTYPVLWAHDTELEQYVVVQPDSEGQLRKGKNRAETQRIETLGARIADTASYAHLNRDFRFNSQALAMAYTDEVSIGGRAWPSVNLPSEDHAKAMTLWQNCTLGLLMYWWVANKQQAGRGSVTVNAAPSLPVLDVTGLTKEQLSQSKSVFESMLVRPLKPMHEIDRDDTRHWLDDRFLGGVLGLPSHVIGGPLQLLRRKLSQEPSVRGGKITVQPIGTPKKPAMLPGINPPIKPTLIPPVSMVERIKKRIGSPGRDVQPAPVAARAKPRSAKKNKKDA